MTSYRSSSFVVSRSVRMCEHTTPCLGTSSLNPLYDHCLGRKPARAGCHATRTARKEKGKGGPGPPFYPPLPVGAVVSNYISGAAATTARLTRRLRTLRLTRPTLRLARPTLRLARRTLRFTLRTTRPTLRARRLTLRFTFLFALFAFLLVFFLATIVIPFLSWAGEASLRPPHLESHQPPRASSSHGADTVNMKMHWQRRGGAASVCIVSLGNLRQQDYPALRCGHTTPCLGTSFLNQLPL